MPKSSKRSFGSNNDSDDQEALLSPITSPPLTLTKRQEQNRAAQRAFRERRAQILKEMEVRLINVERVIDNLAKSIGKINLMEKEISLLKETVRNLCGTVDAMTAPTWTVPSSSTEEYKSSAPIETAHIGNLLNALRPSSTDPTLLSNQ